MLISQVGRANLTTYEGKAARSRNFVDSQLYDRDYFCGECEGYEQFIASQGRTLSNRLAATLELVDIQPGMLVLDVGCGRGESLIWLAQRGAEVYGLDYAWEALRIAKDAIRSADLSIDSHCVLLAANARRLPLPSESFDLVLMLDIIEHLYPWEVEIALGEMRRVLRHDGWLIVHTAPNLWYYKFGYPFYWLFERLRGMRLPKDPRDRFRYHRQVHVNEQSPTSLARALQRAGFQPHVWVADLQQRWRYRGTLMQILGWLATHVYPFKWLFCGDILSKAQKRLD